MGILDEAIREHLELKRQHGAGDSELEELEHDAFGPAERPGAEDGGAAGDPLAEAPTEFMTQPEPAEPAPAAEEETSPRSDAAARIAGLQEPPEAPKDAPRTEPPEDAPRAEAPEEDPPRAEAPPEELDSGPSTQEREVIAEQPTELFDVEEELAASGPSAPSDEDLLGEEMAEPRIGPVDPLSGLDEEQGEIEASVGGEPEAAAPSEDEDDDFFDEQRLSEELDQALEAPREPVEDEEAAGEKKEAPSEEDDAEEPAPPEAERTPEPKQSTEPEPAPEAEEAPAPPPVVDDDMLEETPEFLEESPEDAELWFEQKPPKDFDFDD